jgi:manganese/zinc/iron transport system substrate-binding protein
MPPLIRRRSLLGAALAAPFLATAARTQGVPQVVATTGMIADTARALAGQGAEVRGLMGPGVDPHSYRPTRTDIAAMLGADLTLWHGLFLEAQMEDFLLQLGARRPVVAVAEAVPRDRLLAHDAYPDRFDPHLWFDPELWSLVGAAMAEALHGAGAEAAPDALPAWQAEAAALHAYAADILATVPEDSRVLVTAHDAFRYWGRAYGFEVEGIQGISTESEAGVARIGDLVALLVERGIRAVFVETSVSDRALRALIEGAAARGHEVVIGGSLYSDAMGPEGTYEGTWLGMLDHNATTVARALGGQAPVAGRLGRLSA